MWRVFWVPRDAIRAGVPRRVLAGWEDLPAREDTAGDPIFLPPDYRVDPLLSLYVQSARFRRYTAETRRNYPRHSTTNILLTVNGGDRVSDESCAMPRARIPRIWQAGQAKTTSGHRQVTSIVMCEVPRLARNHSVKTLTDGSPSALQSSSSSCSV
jgi:hypothetical protein